MCGIFGVIASQNSTLDKNTTNKLVDRLFVLSESRGKESAGIAIKNTNSKKISVLKKSIPATDLIGLAEYKKFYTDNVDTAFTADGKLAGAFALIAHARLVTNGSQENNNNNQPVIKQNAVAVHNGIITNVDELWKKYNSIEREYEVDTEVFLAILQNKINAGLSLKQALQATYLEIKGTASTAVLLSKYNTVLLASNNASLYYAFSVKAGLFIFASENFILQQVIDEFNLIQTFSLSNATWSKPFSAMAINLNDLAIEYLELKKEENFVTVEKSNDVADEIKNYSSDKKIDLAGASANLHRLKYGHVRKKLQFNIDAIKKLKRCSKCLLPETFPFISFDTAGVCSYCNSYIVKNQGAKIDEFKQMLNKFRSKEGKPDCIIPFSGGRDSSFGLHYIVKELGMHPITYTYDWGMVTDLARRNIARVCGKLGVENIIVSADMKLKRRNIKLNVEAWLKNPKLGMIPLFMAGDKQFLHFVNKIKEQTGITLNIWSTNSLENTDFKVGFCGISPTFDKTRPDYLPLSSKVGLAWYYMRNFLVNPSYINKSLTDTVSSFYSYYAAPRVDYFQLFDWIKWDEKLIEKTLFEEYDWEISPDTTSTWRIGDGTAAFYNYVYYTVAGFSEFDTFRSNQIREGLITREEGLKFIEQENRPRFESMDWYFETINVDLEKAVDVVNKIPKLYPL